MRNVVLFCCATLLASAANPSNQKPRVLITESRAVVSGDAAVDDVKGSIALNRGTSPQNIEVMRAFQRECHGVSITASRDKADYVVRFDHEGANPTTPFTKGNKVAVFDRNDDLVYTNSTHLLNTAVKDVCTAITKMPNK